MQRLNLNQASSPKLGLKSSRRKAVAIKADTLIQTQLLFPDKTIPLLVEPLVDGLDLVEWASDHRDQVEAWLRDHRALLFRNFRVRDVNTFERFVQAVSNGELLSYLDRTSPRTTLEGQVYTSTVYPADGHILLHNELSYSAQWPLKIFFCCLQVADQGGETPIADIQRVYERIDPAIRHTFEQNQWMLKRNYNQGFGLPWQEVFQTEAKADVEAYCRQHQIEFEWKDDQHLETRQVRAAIHTHPHTGDRIWFNHMAFFHDSSLEPPMRHELMTEFGLENLPYSTYYGDGTVIEAEIVEQIRQAYDQEKVVFAWQLGDILMLDNMLVAHGRHPYVGQRRVVVAMTEAYGIHGEIQADPIQPKP